MKTIPECLAFIKSRQSYHNRKAQALKPKHPSSSAKHQETASNYESVLTCLESQHKLLDKDDSLSLSDDIFSLNPLDMQSLPDDLSNELNITQGDKEDAQILELLEIAGRSLNINELLIGCWRKYKTKFKRNLLTAKIYRLIKRDLVHVVGKGKYAIGAGKKEEGVDDDKI